MLSWLASQGLPASFTLSPHWAPARCQALCRWGREDPSLQALTLRLGWRSQPQTVKARQDGGKPWTSEPQGAAHLDERSERKASWQKRHLG